MKVFCRAGITWTCICFFVFFMPVACVMIRNPPSNITVTQGRDTTFVCNVREQRPSDYVFWKKITRTGFVDILSYNSNVINGSKYSVQGSYLLTVKDIRVEDEAWYECQAGVDRARALLTVNVMMNNMTLTWGTDPPFTEEQLVNLTCHVTNSRPSAEITWFHGKTELTGLASTCQKSSDVDGFGNTTSTLTVVVGQGVDTEPYRCIASLPNSDSSRTELVYASQPMGYSSGCQKSYRVENYLAFTLVLVVQMALSWVLYSSI